jgi:signal transduction histidine kinase/ActR/RegA family two-component response regulator
VEGDRLCKDGRIIQVESSIVLLKNNDGSVAGAISSSRDVTARRRLEEQLRQSQKMESIGTLAGGIAHDFNNILGVIFGYAELSREQAADNSVLANNISQILKAADRAKNLIRQILAFSRKSTFEAVPLRLHLIVKEALALLRASLPSSVSIQSDVAVTNDTVMADATQIHQVVINLCTNAAHAMREKGGTLEVTLKPLDLDRHSAAAYNAIEPGPYVHLSVRDTGTGIAPDIIDRIFEPFFTTKPAGTGTGMGLSVVHGIVKSLKGDVKVYSRPGSGTVFHVVLPREAEQADAQEAAEPAAPGGNESILLIDDEKLLLDVGMRLLNSLGYTVTALHNPVEALELFRQDPAAFDSVITDQTMPDMTGFELARRMLQIRPGIPIILCTGYSDLVTAQSAREAGIGQFINKPLDRILIAKTLRTVLDPQAAHTS